jgi:hypothetical protein
MLIAVPPLRSTNAISALRDDGVRWLSTRSALVSSNRGVALKGAVSGWRTVEVAYAIRAGWLEWRVGSA